MEGEWLGTDAAALAQLLPVGIAAVTLNPGIIDTRMLRPCFGNFASRYPDPTQWANVAAPFLASLGTRHRTFITHQSAQTPK